MDDFDSKINPRTGKAWEIGDYYWEGVAVFHPYLDDSSPAPEEDSIHTFPCGTESEALDQIRNLILDEEHTDCWFYQTHFFRVNSVNEEGIFSATGSRDYLIDCSTFGVGDSFTGWDYDCGVEMPNPFGGFINPDDSEYITAFHASILLGAFEHVSHLMKTDGILTVCFIERCYITGGSLDKFRGIFGRVLTHDGEWVTAAVLTEPDQFDYVCIAWNKDECFTHKDKFNLIVRERFL